MDAVIGPLNMMAEYVDRISKGDIPEKVTDEYKGDFNEVKNNLNQCIDAINFMVSDGLLLVEAMQEGKLDTRTDASRHAGAFHEIIGGFNDTMDTVIGPLNMAAEYIDRISKGDIPENITDEYKGDFNELKNNLNQCIDALRSLIEEDGGVALEAAAKKDLTARVKRDYDGVFELMKNNINTMLQNTEEALSQVTEAVEQISSASNQIASGSQSLAEGANEQASALEEVSSSLEEMSSMTQQNADNANQAKNLSKEASLSADKGNQAMERMKDAIDKIKTSSDETAKIVKTIDEIAFQTNLLALNAAVEAARAGDAGKGFAVVAEEVRNLAQRSAEAAKNTAEMIAESVNNAEGGVKITDEVATTLTEVVDGIGKVNDLVGEIAAASKEQAEGIEQVNTAVAQMNTVTQQNAANSEESASASEELNGQAEELNALVGEFKLSNDGSTRKKLISAKSVAVNNAIKVNKSKGSNKPKKAAKLAKPEAVIPLDDKDLSDF